MFTLCEVRLFSERHPGSVLAQAFAAGIFSPARLAAVARPFRASRPAFVYTPKGAELAGNDLSKHAPGLGVPGTGGMNVFVFKSCQRCRPPDDKTYLREGGRVWTGVY